MQLLQSWKDSLAIFIPKNFKLFFLVTFKAILETFTVLFRYCWAPILLYCACHFIAIRDFLPIERVPDVIQTYVSLATNGIYFRVMTLADVLKVIGFLFMVIFLAARPSVLRKSYRYFAQYWYYWGYVIIALVVLNLLKVVIVTTVPGSWSTLFIVYPVVEWLKIVLFSFFILFLLDSDGSVKAALFSGWRALKMFAYNFPAALLISLCALCASLVVAGPLFLVRKKLAWVLLTSGNHSSTMGIIISSMRDLAFFVGAVIFACFMTNFYIKRLHDQSGLYFETKEKE